MKIPAESLILGITSGLTYALLATGLVLIYKSSRYVNFAHGQLGAFSAVLVAKLANDHGVNYWLAFLAGLMLAAGLGALVELTVIRRLFDAPRVVLMVASIGVAQVLYAGSFLSALRPNPTKLVQHGYPTPFHVTAHVGGFVLRGGDFMILLFAPLAAAAIAYLFRATRSGLRIQAVASNPEAARLAGISVRRVSTNTWVVAALLAALTAILLSPGRGTVNSEVLGPALMTRALAAALIGRMVNLPTAFAAGIGLGIVEQISFANFSQGGTTELVVFALMMAVLLLRARGLASEHRRAEETVPFSTRPRPLPADLAGLPWLRVARVVAAVSAIVVALILPLLPGLNSQSQAHLLSQVVVYAVLGVSLFVLVSWSGQLSLGQFAFVGVGAFTAARLTDHGFSLPFVLLAGGLMGALVAVVIGLPAARVSGLFLGVATLGFAVVAPGWLFRQSWVIPTGDASVGNARVPFIGSVTTARGLYSCAVVVLVLTLIVVSVMRRTIARRLIAVRDNPRAAAAHGLPTVGVNLAGFAISGFIASMAGVLWGYTNVHFDATPFNASLSLSVLALVVVGGLSSPLGAVLGAAAVIGIPTLLHLSPTFIFFTSGASLLGVLLQLPGGLVTHAFRLRDVVLRLLARGRTAPTTPATTAPHTLAVLDNRMRYQAPPKGAQGAATGLAALECRGVTVRFGGLVALDAVSLHIDDGEIVGLIGANGAGKTTLMDCVSGFVSPNAGDITANGRVLAHLGPEYRAYASVGRTFQDARLYPELTVRETMLVALEKEERPTFTSALLRAPWQVASERRAEARADEALAYFGLTGYASTPIGDLPTGVRRTCALAAVVLQRPRLILLDEPTAGIPQAEVAQFGDLIRRLRDELDCAILLIEHDMGLVMGLCNRIYAMEAGRVIAEGKPRDVARDPAVVSSYLGENADTIERSASTILSAPRPRRGAKTHSERRKKAKKSVKV